MPIPPPTFWYLDKRTTFERIGPSVLLLSAAYRDGEILPLTTWAVGLKVLDFATS